MAKTWANIRDEIEQLLQDTANATWTTGEIDYYIDRGLRKIAEYRRLAPERIETFKIESRTGEATSTSAGNLVDTTESQFVSGDVGKVVFNTDDNTFAVIVTFTSSSQVAISKDIFTSGEAYEIYNKDCFSNREINISDVVDWLSILSVEYPTMSNPPFKRNRTLKGSILRIDMDRQPDDSKDVDSDVEVYVKFAYPHFVSQLTDLLGAVDLGAGYAAGATSMVIDGITTDQIIKRGQTFTIANLRGVYTVTTQVTIAAGEATVSFWPGLESAVVDDVVVTFKLSTLTPRLEEILIDWCAGYAKEAKSVDKSNKTNVGGAGVWQAYFTLGRTQRFEAEEQLRRLTPISAIYEEFSKV